MLKDTLGDLLARPARRWTRSRPRIVFYHRIGDGAAGRGLPVRAFEEHLRFIVNNYVPLTLRELLERVSQCRALPETPVVLTFDDGYADFVSDAYPLLEKYGVPATLFAVSDFVLGRSWLWFDEIRYLAMHAPAGSASLRVGTSVFQVRLGDSASRLQTWDEIVKACLRFTTAQRQKTIDDLQRTLNFDVPVRAPPMFAAATAEEIAKLDAQLIEIGSHTQSHPILAMCNDHELRSELHVSRLDLERVVGRPVVSLAYPNGMPGDHDKRARREAKRAGYLGAVLAYGGLPYPNRLRSEPYEIPRMAANADPGAFRREISGLTPLRLRSWIARVASNEVIGNL